MDWKKEKLDTDTRKPTCIMRSSWAHILKGLSSDKFKRVLASGMHTFGGLFLGVWTFVEGCCS